MPDKKLKKISTVRTHPMHVPPSKKHPLGGMTIRKQHPRRIYTSYTSDDLKKITKDYDLKKTMLPTANDLGYPDGNKYDRLIAIWVNYFNKKFPPTTPSTFLDPNVVKALIGSESEFKIKPKNPQAFGIAQITRQTLKALQDPNGEIKDFLFKDIRQKDLLDPEVAIPCGIRWIFQKKNLAEHKLGRSATPEEIILEYKGLLKSKTGFKDNALKSFREKYAKLVKK